MKTEVLWNQLIDSGTEHLILHQGAQIEAEGLAVGMLKDVAYRIQYRIICDANWNVQSMSVKNLLDGKVVTLTKSGEDWLSEAHQVIEALHGCTDVDIKVTPFTNTLPIKRLNLEQGQSKEIAVAYVDVPSLSLSKFEQRYTCLVKDKDDGVYKYESLKSGFTSDLKVDLDRLVVDYPGIFKMVWKKTE
jgi:uncharacterized protein